MIENVKKVLSQFADDTWTVSRANEKSFKVTLSEFKDYEYFTGLTINYDKTEILRIGSWKSSNAKFYSDLPLKWSDGQINVLGMSIFAQLDNTVEDNCNKVLEQVKLICKRWANRDLSLLGKIQICNTLLISKILHISQVLHKFTDSFTKGIKQCMREFIWDGKKPKIAFDKLTKSYETGGLKLQDPIIKLHAFHINWIYQYHSDLLPTFLTASIKYWCRKYIANMSPTELNLNKTDAKRILSKNNTFWGQHVASWCNFSYSPLDVTDIRKQALWYNSNMKCKGKLLCMPSLYHKGCKTG